MTEDNNRYPEQGAHLSTRVWRFSFCEDTSEELKAARVGPNTWRLEETPFLSETTAAWHDIIEGTIEPDDTVKFTRVAQTSGFLVFQQTLALEALRSPALLALADRLRAEGGWWENAMGGVVIVHVPASAAYLIEECNAIIGALPSTQAARGGGP